MSSYTLNQFSVVLQKSCWMFKECHELLQQLLQKFKYGLHIHSVSITRWYTLTFSLLDHEILTVKHRHSYEILSGALSILICFCGFL